MNEQTDSVKPVCKDAKDALRADREFWDTTVRELVVYGERNGVAAVDIANHLLFERRKLFPGLDEGEE